MKLEKYKIQEKKFGFVVLCIMFLIGLVSMTKIADFMTETVEIEALVVHTYETPYNRFTHNPGRSQNES